MKERIKKIRKSNKLTQQEFADILGIKQNTVASYEMGRIGISDAVINSICREFSINEDWLRYGTGEMYIPTADKLESYLGMISKGDDDFIKDIIEVYMELDQTSKEALKQIGLKMADKIKKREQE